MNLQNGYKVIYEKTADGKRTFYAAKSNEYPTRNEVGEIIDDIVASFEDSKFLGKTIYEHKGKFYVSAGRVPAYDKDGEPDVANGETDLGFDLVLTEGYTPSPAMVVDEPEAEVPAAEEPEEDETEADPEEDEVEETETEA